MRAGAEAQLAMLFTCGRCDTRAAKRFSRRAYETGVVIVDCPGCGARHVVADRLGWLGAPGGVETFLAARGESVTRRGGADEPPLELSADELAGAGLRAALEAHRAKLAAGVDSASSTAAAAAAAAAAGAAEASARRDG